MMYCENCLKTNKKIYLFKFSDAYSCPQCYHVSNEIVFGKQSSYSNTLFSQKCGGWVDNGLFNTFKNHEKINSEIENVCIFLNLTSDVITKSNNIYLEIINKKKKSCYSLDYYKVFSILKACSEENVYIDPLKICGFFNLNYSKFLRFQKYAFIKQIGYFCPSNMSQECHKLLNVLNVKNYSTKNYIISQTLNMIKKSDISVKIVLLYVYCNYFKISPKSACFKKYCMKLGVNFYTVHKYYNKITGM